VASFDSCMVVLQKYGSLAFCFYFVRRKENNVLPSHLEMKYGLFSGFTLCFYV
jgi:hypothetical protein